MTSSVKICSSVDENTHRGVVFDIQHFCTHDGPGIRTTVFLKGCPLNCWWCHNPEGQRRKPEIFYTPSLCTRCGSCAEICPEGAHQVTADEHLFIRARCSSCFACVNECDYGALETAGFFATSESILDEVTKDRVFYEESGGGLTVSGGEPFLQPSFLFDLLRKAHEVDINTCVETCGYADLNDLMKAVPLVDLFLWDIKDTDPDRHLQNTGVSLAHIVSNLQAIDVLGAKTRLRCILLPDVNLTRDHLDALAKLYNLLTHCEGIELLPFHPLGASKAARLGRNLASSEIRYIPSSESISDARNYLLSAGVSVL